MTFKQWLTVFQSSVFWWMLRNIPCNVFCFCQVKFWWNTACNLLGQMSHCSFFITFHKPSNSKFFNFFKPSNKKEVIPNNTTVLWHVQRSTDHFNPFYHALLSTFEKQHANKTSMKSFWCRFWGGWLASMGQPARMPAKLPPHYTSEQHSHCFWPRKCKDLYLCGLKPLWISTFECLCVKHFLFILNSNPYAKLKG